MEKDAFNTVTEVFPEVMALMKSCGEILRNANPSSADLEQKEGRQNFVTEYDSLIQEKLREGLDRTLPGAAFFGEENGEQDDIRKGIAFIVDPIDGTSNFMKGLGHNCISIGITVDAHPAAGAVYEPYKDEMYHAVRGGGAFLNDTPIHVNKDTLETGIVSMGTAPYFSDLTDVTFEKLRYYFDRCIDIRRFGSAALDLCDVAAGRTCLYLELSVAPWDCAAGALIVEEAGGKITDGDGNPMQYLHRASIKATNGVAE